MVKKKKLGIRDIAHIKESQTLFLNMNIRMRNFLVHKIYNSCYGYFEKLFQSKFYRKKWKNTKVMLCQYCINISLEINFWVESWLKSEMSALCRSVNQYGAAEKQFIEYLGYFHNIRRTTTKGIMVVNQYIVYRFLFYIITNTNE